MSEWKEVRIGDFALVRGGKRLPKGKMLTAIKNSHPYIRIRDLGQEKVLEINDTYEYVDDETQQVISRYIVSTNDVLISIVGTIGLIAIVGKSLDNANLTENCVKLVNIEGVDREYLYYFLVSKPGQDAIKNEVVGAVQQKLPIKNIQNIKVPLPSLTEQRRIASILSSLDDKIAVNRKICENLEAQAQALFKHWFIDFAPFKDGKFVESELGMIPEGWKVGTLTEIADYVNGLAMQKFPPLSEDDAIPVLKIKELGQSQCDANSDKCSKQIKPEYIVNNGDVVFSWSGTLLVDIWCGGVCGLNQHLFKVTSKEYPKWFYLMWTKHHLDEFIRIAKDKAVTMGHIKRGDLDKALVTIPNKQTLDSMTEMMHNFINEIINTRLESSRLSTLRDTLLPKLMKGEIEV